MTTDFLVEGQSVDNVPADSADPFFFESLPGSPPHELVFSDDGRTFTYEYATRACLETDPACTAPLSEVRSVGDGLVMLAGDDPAVIAAGAAGVNAFFSNRGFGTDLPAYLTQLAALAPANWAAISVTTSDFLIQEGVNCTGSFCSDVTGGNSYGVGASYTLPEPTGALPALVLLGAMAGLAHSRRRTARPRIPPVRGILELGASQAYLEVEG